MEAFGAKTPVWDYDHLYEFLKSPQAYVQGTKMTFVGLKKPEDRINIIAFLHSKGGTLPIPAPNPAKAAAAAGGAAPGAAPNAATPTATGSTANAGVAGEKSAAGGPAGQGAAAPAPGAAAQVASTTSGPDKAK